MNILFLLGHFGIGWRRTGHGRARGGEATPAGAGRGWLPRIAFKGFCDPAEHYARAKMLLLTSDFEGFGLVLVEAMSAGCVPIALGSYLAVHDIIADNKDGRILSMPYEERKLVDAVLPLTRDAAAWARMSVAAREKSKSFALDRILRQWSDLLSAGQ